jgi:hypothetical protein
VVELDRERVVASTEVVGEDPWLMTEVVWDSFCWAKGIIGYRTKEFVLLAVVLLALALLALEYIW